MLGLSVIILFNLIFNVNSNLAESSAVHSCYMYESSSGSTNPSRLFPLVSVSDIGGGGRRRERSEAASKLEPYRKHLHSCATTYQTLYILQCNVSRHQKHHSVCVKKTYQKHHSVYCTIRSTTLLCAMCANKTY